MPPTTEVQPSPPPPGRGRRRRAPTPRPAGRALAEVPPEGRLAAEASHERRGRLTRWALGLLPLVLLGLAGWALHRELEGFRWHDVWASAQGVPRARLGLALGAVVLGYAALTLYDVLALRHLGRPLPYARVGFAAFLGYALGHSIGLPFLSGGSVRLRLYSGWGLSALEVTQVVAFNTLTFWLGLLALSGAALLTGAAGLPGVALPLAASRGVGAVLLLLVAGYVAACARVRRPLTVRGLSLALPTPGLALAQLGVSALDWVLAAAVLVLLLPPAAGVSLPALVVLFVVAQLAGVVSQVPGGVGVFESVVVAALGAHVPAAQLLGLLLVYRVLYYVLPFGAAALLLAGHELVRRREALTGAARVAHASFAPVVPTLAALGAFLAGSVLLFSGATPTLAHRLDWLSDMVPLPVLEASHLLGSAVGMALLLLARALQRRLDGAFVVALGLLGLGAVASLAKGADYEEALLLTVLALALMPFRGQFYRRTWLLAEPFSAGWLAAAGLVTAASVWLGFFSYQHVDYSRDLWWRFAFEADAPRFLRATVGAFVVALAVGAAHLLEPARARVRPAGDEELARVRPLVARSPESMSHLALVGDKALLFAPADRAFLMYGVSGRSWVALGDPVGPNADATELAWTFRQLVDEHHGWTCFYQVGPQQLTRYLDLGLALLKLGEEATVPLAAFDLEGPSRRTLRHAFRRHEREGLSFEVVPREAVAALLPVLQDVSERWMAHKGTREKGFSLGYFQPRYLQEGPVALVHAHGRVVGFANVWAPASRAELSVDLMRYLPDAPREVMDYLFVSLMLWGKAQGYARFNLGMAPFSGFEERALAPRWHRMGAFLFRHGEHFYNFQGLRAYKEKFDPEWTPRYLAAPGGLALPRVLANIAALVSRGLTGVVTK